MLQAWDGEGTGLIVSERLVNCPPQLAPPLVKGLFDEISAAAKAKVSPSRLATPRQWRYLKADTCAVTSLLR